MSDADETRRGGTSRRSLLFGGAIAGAAVAAAAADHLLGSSAADPGGFAETARPSRDLNGERRVPFYGARQAGVTSIPGAHATYLSLSLASTVSRGDIERWLRILTDDAARMTQGDRPLADQEHELLVQPAGLTITLGFGPELVARAGAEAPDWLRPLPAFDIDQLEDRFSAADLLILLHGDDPSVIAHASRMLLRDSRSFATLAWRQTGFRRAYGTDAPGTTMRNLFGQLDGTTNARPGTAAFDEAVWARADAPAWLRHHGTSLVLRRIAMNLDGWEEVGRDDRSKIIGRRIDDGAPITGGIEHSAPDFEATTALGFPFINDVAHIRRARAAGPRESIVRIAYSYDDAADDAPASAGEPALAAISNAGLLFGSWQADVTKQFVPIQQRLAEADLLNTWTTPIGSTVVAVPPGCQPGGFIGEGLFA